MKPPASLKALVMAHATREPSPNRPAAERKRALAWLGAGLCVLLVFGGLGGMRAVQRPVGFVLGTAAGWTSIALLATWASSRRKSMLGRPRGVLWLLAGTTPLALEASYAGFMGRANFLAAASPMRLDLACMLATLAMAVAPFAIVLAERRGSDPTHPRATGAALGAVCGAWGAVFIDLHCEHADLAHVTLGHVLPVVLMALGGAVLGQRWLSVRSDSP
jgi:hypothetical protein